MTDDAQPRRREKLKASVLGGVWLLENDGDGPDRIIKELDPEPSVAPSAHELSRMVAKFIESARVQREVADRPSVERWAKILDIHPERRSAYYIAEHYAKSVQSLIAVRASTEPSAVARIAAEVIQGLEELRDSHARSHGNLKPSNVFLAPAAQGHGVGSVRLADPAPSEDIRRQQGPTQDLADLGAMVLTLLHRTDEVFSLEQSLEDEATWARLKPDDQRWRDALAFLLEEHRDPANLVLAEARRRFLELAGHVPAPDDPFAAGRTPKRAGRKRRPLLWLSTTLVLIPLALAAAAGGYYLREGENHPLVTQVLDALRGGVAPDWIEPARDRLAGVREGYENLPEDTRQSPEAQETKRLIDELAATLDEAERDPTRAADPQDVTSRLREAEGLVQTLAATIEPAPGPSPDWFTTLQNAIQDRRAVLDDLEGLGLEDRGKADVGTCREKLEELDEEARTALEEGWNAERIAAFLANDRDIVIGYVDREISNLRDTMAMKRLDRFMRDFRSLPSEADPNRYSLRLLGETLTRFAEDLFRSDSSLIREIETELNRILAACLRAHAAEGGEIPMGLRGEVSASWRIDSPGGSDPGESLRAFMSDRRSEQIGTLIDQLPYSRSEFNVETLAECADKLAQFARDAESMQDRFQRFAELVVDSVDSLRNGGRWPGEFGNEIDEIAGSFPQLWPRLVDESPNARLVRAVQLVSNQADAADLLMIAQGSLADPVLKAVPDDDAWILRLEAWRGLDNSSGWCGTAESAISDFALELELVGPSDDSSGSGGVLRDAAPTHIHQELDDGLWARWSRAASSVTRQQDIVELIVMLRNNPRLWSNWKIAGSLTHVDRFNIALHEAKRLAQEFVGTQGRPSRSSKYEEFRNDVKKLRDYLSLAPDRVQFADSLSGALDSASRPFFPEEVGPAGEDPTNWSYVVNDADQTSVLEYAHNSRQIKLRFIKLPFNPSGYGAAFLLDREAWVALCSQIIEDAPHGMRDTFINTMVERRAWDQQQVMSPWLLPAFDDAEARVTPARAWNVQRVLDKKDETLQEWIERVVFNESSRGRFRKLKGLVEGKRGQATLSPEEAMGWIAPPSPMSPMSQISLRQADWLCRRIGCRIPTREEWLAAFNVEAESVGLGGERAVGDYIASLYANQSWNPVNVRDLCWERIYELVEKLSELYDPHIAKIPKGVMRRNVHAEQRATSMPTIEDLVMPRRRDGFAFFANVDRNPSPSDRFTDLIGNVAEFVVGGADGHTVIIPLDDILSGNKTEGMFGAGVMGGSALGPLETDGSPVLTELTSPQDLMNVDATKVPFTDVGFRPVIRTTASPETPSLDKVISDARYVLVGAR